MLYLLTHGCWSDYGVQELIEAPAGLTNEDWRLFQVDKHKLYEGLTIHDATPDDFPILAKRGWRKLPYLEVHEGHVVGEMYEGERIGPAGKLIS